ncbi:MAG TPA: hypothetical protein VJB59_10415 [Bdellovibrionota bacterium]|nr:hypothetical protein [Bdellovibrionota bacterium]
MKFRVCAAVSVFVLSSIGSGICPVLTRAALPELSIEQRADLRYHLQNLLNEFELLIMNRKVDEGDVRRQERQFKALKVFDRIPLGSEDIQGLRAEMKEGGKKKGIKVSKLTVLSRSKPGPRLPGRVPSNWPFRFQESQLTKAIRFELQVEGDAGAVNEWVRSWKEAQLRLVEPTDRPKALGTTGRQWRIRGRAFSFREVRLPVVIPRRARDLLPDWVQANPSEFSQKAPDLRKLVDQIEELRGRAAPFYRLRQEFLLNGARMSFFMRKAS